MAMQDRNAANVIKSAVSMDSELTHREDYARNGDYLGRQPGDARNRFDIAMQDSKMEDRFSKRPPVMAELTHSEDYARNGDYLGRQPGDVSGQNHFDEEYFVDESENENDAEMPEDQESVQRH
jgi:hypothetical protein